MASSPELVQYIADQLSPCGTITFKKMFGKRLPAHRKRG